MREYLFRGKRKDRPTEWVYGFYGWSMGKHYITEVKVEHPSMSNPGGDYQENSYEVIEETIGQYTNKLDKNQKQVFEGDIQKDEVNQTIEVCRFNKETGSFGFDIYGWNDWDESLGAKWELLTHESFDYYSYLEVVANETDNPELLK